MREGIWDSNSTISRSTRNDKDLPFIDYMNDDELLQWMNNDLNDKYDSKSDRLEYIKRLERMYEGEVYDVGPKFTGINDLDESTTRRPSSIFNYMNEMTEAKMSQRAKFKSGIQVIPAKIGIEYENQSECVKSLITAKAQEIDIDSRISDGDKSNFITGCSYTFIPWNKNIGPINPIFKEALEVGIDVSDFRDKMYLGDLDVQVYGPDRAFHQLGKRRWKDVEDITMVDFVLVDELKADHPEVADKIQSSMSDYVCSKIAPEEFSNDSYALVGCYYRKPTKYMPSGAYVKFTRGAILSVNFDKYPYKDGKLPVVYDTDIDLRDSMNGKPFLSNIDKLQRLHDMTSASMARGIAITNAPKWFYQKGSVDPQKLGNNYSSVEVRGPIEPKLVSFNGLPVGGFEMLSVTERGIVSGSAVSQTSRGEPPKDVTSAVALQFLNEVETGREALGIAKRQARTLEIYKMMLSRIQQYYTPQDGRIFRYLGDDNTYLIQSFENLNIEGDFDIKFENSPSLPDTKSARIATVIEFNKANPAEPVFNKESILQMFDLGNDKRFRNQSLSAIKAAQFKLQQILDGTGYTEPKSYDDFLVEYPIFIQALRQREYKGSNESVMIGLQNYIKSMEYLMWEKSKMNPTFQMKAMAFTEYPVFFRIPITPPQAPENKSTQEIIVNDKSKQEEQKQ